MDHCFKGGKFVLDGSKTCRHVFLDSIDFVLEFDNIRLRGCVSKRGDVACGIGGCMGALRRGSSILWMWHRNRKFWRRI